MTEPLIVLTNDDGIHSKGLEAAAWRWRRWARC